jgi:RNA polymerase sigma factor (sigma-70 family)
LKFIKKISGKNTHEDESAMLMEYQRTGDLEILGKLYEQYMPLIYGLCLKYLKDEDQSKDAVMQIFEQLIEKLRIHKVENFKNWLYALARNHCLMILRAYGKHNFVSIEAPLVENDSFLHLDIDESRERQFIVMERCMETLPVEQRNSIRLFYLEQKCYSEVAAITGFDMNKVKSYIQNGKRNLKICMEKNSES